VLTPRHSQRGVSLIEVAIGLVVTAILLATALPNFSAWLQNSKIRTTAEAILNGLQMARAEAVRRNTLVRFQLTDAISASCAVNTTGTSWVISLDDPTGACNTAASDTVAPRIIQTRSGEEGSSNVVVAAGQSPITFNGTGRQPTSPAPANITIAVTNPTGGACATATATSGMRCLNVVVSTGGQVRMCDPAVVVTTDPRAC
jgi:type IV fimbrial biogenesis protein FimT